MINFSLNSVENQKILFINFAFEKYFIFNLKTYEFKSYFNISEEQFEQLNDKNKLKEMDKVLAAPEGLNCTKSYWCDTHYLSELNIENSYLVYHIGTTNSDMITIRDNKFYVERIYDISNIDVGIEEI